MAHKPIDKRKLAKLLGMLGSFSDGEVANAGRMANDMIRNANLTWFDVIKPPFNKTAYQRELMRKRRRRSKETS